MDLDYQGRLASEALAWQVRLFEGKTRRTDYDPNVSGSAPDYYLRSDQKGAQAQMTASRANDHLTLGIDWVNYEVRSIYDAGDSTYDNPAAFVMAKKSLLDDRLILSVGGRYDDYEVEGDQGQSVDDTNWSSSAGASYKIGKTLVARFNVAESFRMPTTEELYMYRDYGAWGIWSGNPDLSPEKSRTWEAGLDVKRGPVSAGATYFYSTFDDYITYEEGLPGQYTYANLDGATLSGLEANLSWDLGETFALESALRPFMSLTFLTDYTDEQNNRDLQYTSEWTLAGGIEYIHVESGLSSRFNVSYFSEQDINDYNGTGDTTLDSYAVADLSIAKDLLDWGNRGKLAIKGDIQNLFNQNYAAVQGYPMPGRALYISLKYTY
jgi:vitamin B12 transporter